MTLITLNVPSEVKERLRLEPNQSELVTRLLYAYFEDVSSFDLKKRFDDLERQKKIQEQVIERQQSEIQDKINQKLMEETKIKETKDAQKRVKEMRDGAEVEA